MRDYFSELDENGNKRRRKRVLPDGATYHFPYVADHGFRPTFADGTPDHTSPHRPGYRFSDTNDPDRLAADEAYAARSRRMETAWQRKHDEAHDQRSVRTASLDELRTQADQAWQERNVRMQNAWRTSKEV